MKYYQSPFQTVSLNQISMLTTIFFGFILACSIVIFLQHKNRTLYTQLQTLKKTEILLTTEWSQLLLEKSTWSSDFYVESIARNKLGMFMLTKKQSRILKP